MPTSETSFGPLPLEVEVEIRCKGQPNRIFRTAQLHPGGLLLFSDDQLRPDLGVNLLIQLVGTLGQDETPPIVKARVRLHVPGGFTVVFEE